jgi:acyl-CoA reductase-like NAD-dependent aldehyde dehydrogenase
MNEGSSSAAPAAPVLPEGASSAAPTAPVLPDGAASAAPTAPVIPEGAPAESTLLSSSIAPAAPAGPHGPIRWSSAAEVAEIVRLAREGQEAWGALPVSARIRALRGVKKRILQRGDEIADILLAECKKPIEEALLSEVLPNADLVDYWTDAIEELLEPEEVDLDALAYPGKSGRTYREPRGVIALITPWNLPVSIPLRSIVPALLAGNAIVFKPSEVTPRAGALVASLFDGLLPYGVLGIVQGAGDVGAAVVESDVDLVIFTGSVRTGRRIAEACAKRLVPCSLELGGKDAAIVLADANLERAARGIVWGALYNAGQNCASIERVYVESAIAEAFIKRVTELTAELRPGIDVGGLTTGAQLGIVRDHVDEAVRSGAQVLCRAGEPGAAGETYYPPTVLRVTDEATPLLTEETFGPVLPIVVVTSAEEAIAKANASRYGLTASIWTKHVARGELLAKKLRAGVVTINNHSFTGALAGAPWSGIGESGFGITNSPHALAEMTRPRFVLVDSFGGKKDLWWYPYTDTLRTIARAMITLRGGGGFVAKIRAVFALLGAFPRRLLKE